MGYTTEFVGRINLSRKLTLAEAKTLIEIGDMNQGIRRGKAAATN